MNRKKSNNKRGLCTSRMLTAIIVLSVFTAGIGILPVSANPDPSVTRDLPDVPVNAGEEIVVGLTQEGFLLDIVRVDEILPEGFEYVEGSFTGYNDELHLFYDQTNNTLMVVLDGEEVESYNVTAGTLEQIEDATFWGVCRGVVGMGPEEDLVEGDSELIAGPSDITPPIWDTTVGITSAADTGNGGEVTVTYGAAADADSPPVKYNVYYSTSSPATGGTKLSDVGPSPYTVTGLMNGQLYYFSVRVEDSAAPPNEDTNTVELTATPTAPDETPPTWDTTVGVTLATDTGNGGEVTVTYGAAADADSPPVKYNVYYSTSSPATGGTKLSDVGPSPYTVTGLMNGQLYYFSVRAEDSAASPNEDTNTVELTATPTAPHCFTIDFVTGYNMITMPLDDPSVITGLSLITKIGGNCLEIYKWNKDTQSWVSNNPQTSPPSAFDIEGGEGYFVRMSGPAEGVEFCGEGWTSPFIISLVSGYNMMGMPVNDTSVTNGSALVARIGGNCQEVFKWNKDTQSWVSNNPQTPPAEAFDIEGGEGYFVRMSGDADVTFTGEPWQN